MQSPRTEAPFADARKATIAIVPDVTRRARSERNLSRNKGDSPRPVTAPRVLCASAWRRNVWCSNDVVFAATKRPISSRQKQWSEHYCLSRRQDSSFVFRKRASLLHLLVAVARSSQYNEFLCLIEFGSTEVIKVYAACYVARCPLCSITTSRKVLVY
jgi:hypothetical protein